MRIFRTTRTLQETGMRWLTKAINGTFTEETYDETELSRLESKWKQYFTMSSMSMERTKAERENIQSMISDISHQMKTPLANIMLYSELLQEQTEGEQEKYLAEQIETYAKKLEFLTTALVKMSRLESDVFKNLSIGTAGRKPCASSDRGDSAKGKAEGEPDRNLW